MSLSISTQTGVAKIVLDRPLKLNAIDAMMARELKKAALSVEADASVKVVVLTATGRAFSVGEDLTEFMEKRAALPSHVADLAADFHAALIAFKRMPAPLIVGVNGTAAGGGFSLACHGDLVVAKRSAKFVSAFTKSGLTPSGGVTFSLPMLVGRQRAFELMATNRTLTAQEALDLGMVSRLVDDLAFEPSLDALAIAVADLASGAAQQLKKLIHRGELEALEAHLAAEAEAMVAAASRPETLSKLEAFLSKS